MNVYDYIKKYAAAVVADATVLTYCKDNFNRGLLVAVDDDSEKMLGSEDAPYCLFMPTLGTDDSPVAETATINIRIEVGTTPPSEPPYYTTTTTRSKTANGLQQFGQGEAAVDLLDLILTAIKGVQEDDACRMLTNSTIDASGALLFPLALAVSNLIIAENKSLASFD